MRSTRLRMKILIGPKSMLATIIEKCIRSNSSESQSYNGYNYSYNFIIIMDNAEVIYVYMYVYIYLRMNTHIINLFIYK